MDTTTENALIVRCKNRDSEAFRLLVEHYKKQAFAFAFSYLRNADDALNVSQDAFVRAWKAMDGFIEGKSFKAWIMCIVKNLSLNLLEKKRNRRETSLDAAMEESGFDVPGDCDDPLDQLEKDELRRCIWKIVLGLKEEFRDVIVLKHFHDLSYREISESLEIPEGTVMSRLYYARLELKKALEPIVRGVDVP